MKIDFADTKVFARFNLLDPILESFGTLAWFFVVNIGAFTNVGVAGLSGDIYRTIDSAQQHAKAAGVIAVFVCEQHAVEPLHVFSDHCEPARELFGAQAGIDEDASFAGNDQNCIAR